LVKDRLHGDSRIDAGEEVGLRKLAGRRGRYPLDYVRRRDLATGVALVPFKELLEHGLWFKRLLLFGGWGQGWLGGMNVGDEDASDGNKT
jgi:hypothetical protein